MRIAILFLMLNSCVTTHGPYNREPMQDPHAGLNMEQL